MARIYLKSRTDDGLFDTEKVTGLFERFRRATGIEVTLIELPCSDSKINLFDVSIESLPIAQAKTEDWTFHEASSAALIAVRLVEVTDRFRGVLVAGRAKAQVGPAAKKEDFLETLGLLADIGDLLVEQAAVKIRWEAEHSQCGVAEESADWLRTLINAMPDIVCFKDGQGRWLLANPSDLELFELVGVDYKGKTDAELAQYAGFYREAFLTCMDSDEEAWKAGVVSRADELIPRPDGSTVVLDVFKVPTFNPDGTRRGLVVVGRDVTERRNEELRRRELEEQIHQSQKMEAVGRLAGGVAHDLNNLLTPILGNAELLGDFIGEAHESFDCVADIKAAAARAKDLIAGLMTFSRKRDIRLEVLDLNEVLRGFQRLLQHATRKDISLIFQFCEESLAILADSSLLERVIMNLVVNSQDSMPSGGRIIVGTEIFLGEQPEAPRWAMLTVRDTGVGIPEEIVNKIFEPFFTTKTTTAGTGLGLATVYSIVQRLGGTIDVSSALGEGTEFQIRFPLSTRQVSPTPMPAGERRASLGSERVAVVEDEPLVRHIVTHSLRQLNYDVLIYESPMDCLQDLLENDRAVELLVTDVMMPEMNGVELHRALKEQRPRLRTLFMSAYSEQVLADDMHLKLQSDFIQKPFLPRELARRVRTILDR